MTIHTARVTTKTATIEQVKMYLPSNYRAFDVDEEIFIQGFDAAGWTFNDYIVPRLASVMIFLTTECEECTVPYDEHDEGCDACVALKPDVPTGSISHGTHRTVDLLDAFLGFLEMQRPALYDEVLYAGGDAAQAWRLGWLHDDQDVALAAADEWLSEDVWSAMESIAPAGHTFGAHEGDGADFGYWPIDEDED